ncbi:MAG: metal-dependent hydrolase, partial [Leptospiraceae bacterium]|nr:metal-dependent hydrolase [Leptospiraceae bacterium]
IALRGYPVAEASGYVKALLGFINKHASKQQKLAVTAAIEHFSSVMSDRFLRYPAINQVLEPAIREFLVWHCVEEIEHKAVAFDLYQALYGGYFTRIAAMLLVTVFFIPSVFGVQFAYLRHDGELYNRRAWWQAVVHFWFKPGWFSRIPSGYLPYYLRRFHPWQHDNSKIVKNWIERNDQV